MLREKTHGNIDGIRSSFLNELDTLFDVVIPEDIFLPEELMETLASYSARLNREIAIYITRSGEVVDVIIGSDQDVELQDMRLRRNQKRLSCIRCIHTHPNAPGALSDMDLTALKSYRYDAMAAIGVKEGKPTSVQAAFLTGHEQLQVTDLVSWRRIPQAEWMDQIEQSDHLVGNEGTMDTTHQQERAGLMGIESDSSLQELKRLAETAGAMVVGSFLQKKDKPDREIGRAHV